MRMSDRDPKTLRSCQPQRPKGIYRISNSTYATDFTIKTPPFLPTEKTARAAPDGTPHLSYNGTKQDDEDLRAHRQSLPNFDTSAFQYTEISADLDEAYAADFGAKPPSPPSSQQWPRSAAQTQ
jgi:hypothetical protein